MLLLFLVQLTKRTKPAADNQTVNNRQNMRVNRIELLLRSICRNCRISGIFKIRAIRKNLMPVNENNLC